MKFQRIFSMAIEIDADTVVQIQYPLTLVFDVNRNTLATSNTGHFRIYNLKPETRNQIFHDRNATLDYKRIKVQAGYEDQSPLPEIFTGNIIQAYSRREGTNWVTEIEAFDGGFGILNGQVSQTVPKGWNLRQLITTVLGTIPKTSVGAVGDLTGDSSRGITLMGNSWNLLSGVANSNNASAFIDGEVSNILKRNEYVSNAPAITIIDSSTGLLETPRRSNALMEVTTLFEPRLRVGQLVQVQSLETVYNGKYKVLGVAHRGTISGAVGGDCTTVASLDLGTAALVPVMAAAS